MAFLMNWLLVSTFVSASVLRVAFADCDPYRYSKQTSACSDEYNRANRQSLEEQEYEQSRNYACCGLLQLDKCISNAMESTECEMDSDLRRKRDEYKRQISGKSCDTYDYRLCNSASPVSVSALVLLMILGTWFC